MYIHMNVSKIKSFFKVNKKSFFYAGLFVFSFFLFSDAAFANTNWIGLESDVVNDGIKIVNYILIMSSALLWAATALISLFLTPGWVNGTIFGLDGYMKEMWIMVSNVVYFIFAFILIMIAFMNIIGKWDKWELKSALPKFIVWVIMVPFTWFFVQFVLSISAILTVGVLTLPYDTFESKSTYKEAIAEMQKIIKNPNATNTDWEIANEWIPTTFILNLSQNLLSKNKENETTFIKKDEFLAQWNDRNISEILAWDGESGYENSVFGVLGLYTYGIMQIQYLDTESWWMFWKAVWDITDMTLKLIFDALFIIVYLVLMIALFLALLVRGIKLWVYAMLSPAFGLLYFFDKADGVWEWQGKFWIKDFISLALVPVYVAAALSFGLLFIMVSSYGMWTSSLMKTCTPADIEWVTTSIEAKDMNCMDIGWFMFAIHGGVWESTSWSESWWAFGRIIMQLFGIVVLWIAVMTALKQSEITNKITEPIQQLGWNVWSLIAKSPTYAPIIPGLPSVQWMSRISTMPQQAMETRVANNVSPYQSNINSLFGTNTISASDEARFNNILKNGIETEWELNEIRSMYKWWVAEFGRNNTKLQKIEQSMLQPLSETSLVTNKYAVSSKEVNDEFFKAMLDKQDSAEVTRLKNAKNPWEISKDDLKDNAKVIAWDLKQEKLSHTDMTQIKNGVDIGNDRDKDQQVRIKFVGDKSWNHGIWEIYIKAKNDSELHRYNINLQTIGKSDSVVSNDDDLKELKKLYSALWKEDGNFKEVLDNLWFSKTQDLLNSVKKKDD